MTAEIERLAPFHHEVALPHGLSTQPPGSGRRPGERVRMSDVLTLGWPALLERYGGSLAGKRVLDVGCNCGGFSIHAANDGAEYVLGVDVVDRYLDQAQFIKEALDVDQVEFARLGVDDLDPAELGSFDVTLCLGLLYHLENPVPSMRKLAEITTGLILLDTNVERRRAGRPFWRMNIARQSSADAPSATTSLWRTEDSCQFLPTPAAATELLRFLGFADVTRLTPHEDMSERYLSGNRATFIAAREPGGPPAGDT